MLRKHFLAAQCWYGVSQGAPAFINPFLNLFFARIGLTPSQIGLLSALRPWISAPCGSIVAGLADRWGAHRFMLLFTYLAMTLIQGMMALPVFASFAAMLALTVLTSTVSTPASIIADAAVMAASTHPGDYGRLRTWASLSWSAFAPVAGWVNSTYSIRAGIACYVVGSLVALPAAYMLPVEALRRKIAPIIERRLSKEAEEVAALLPAAAVAAGGAGVGELQQPLLAEEAPPTPPSPAAARQGLSKAMAIIRYIEAITELGVAPPAGAGMYGYAALPLQYASQHLAPASQEPQPSRGVAAGYSPFAGTAEPGSESPPYATSPPADSAVSASPSAASPPVARLPCTPGQAGPDTAAAQKEVHSSIVAPGSFQQQQRGATLLRLISADNLGRVASLAHGIPRVRTRPLLSAPVEPHFEDAASSGEDTPSPASDFELSPFTGHPQRRLGGQLAEDGGEEAAAVGAMFDADDILAGSQHAQQRADTQQQQRQQLQAAPSASVLLRDIRGVRPQLLPAAAADSSGRIGSDELPVSVGADQAAASAVADAVAAEAAAVASAAAAAEQGQGALGTGVAPGVAGAAAVTGSDSEAAPSSPVYRSAAFQRLAQIFGSGSKAGVRPDGSSGSGSGGRGAPGSAAGTPAAAATRSSSGTSGDLEAGEGARGLSPGEFTPVRRYINYRQGKLERAQQRRQQREAVAAAEGREPEPHTPMPSSASVLAGALFGSITPSLMAAAQQGADVDPQAMREALDLELQDAQTEHDPTGTLIVKTLSKKLERLAAETKRQQRLRRRTARQAAAAAAAAAAAGAAAAPTGEGPLVLPSPQRLPAVPEQAEVAAAVKEEQLSFGAALKRLFSDPQVVIFFVLTTILGFGHGIIGSFLFMYLAEMGGSELLMGYVLMANALPELPAFFFFGRILAVLGMNTVLFLAAGTLGLRILTYSLLPSISLNWIIPIEALHAITFACGWSASAVNSSKIAPPGLESTTQAIFQGLWTGVGCGMAGLLGGVLYGTHGPQFLFKLSGMIILGATAAAAIPTLVLRWRRKHREVLPPESYDKLPSFAH